MGSPPGEREFKMDMAFWIVVVVVIVIGGLYLLRSRGATQARSKESIDDAAAEARRWVERLGGQVYSLDTLGNAAAAQAVADASERFTAAGSQVEQAKTVRQYRLAQQSAYEGLYYISAARTTLGLDPGPALPPIPGQQQAGAVTEGREVCVAGHDYRAAPVAGDDTRHYYPGGMVAGRPVPRGWYSEPWWRPALVAGAWGVGAYLVAGAMFSGMAGTGYDAGYQDGAGADGSGEGGDASGYDGGDFDSGGDGGDFDGGFDGGGSDSGFDGGGFDGGFDGGGFDGGFDF